MASLNTLAEYTPESMRGWFVKQGMDEAGSDSAEREKWSFADQNGNTVHSLSAYNEYNKQSIFDQINEKAGNAGWGQGDVMSFQERDSIFARLNSGQIQVRNGLREGRGKPEEWTHLEIDIPQGLNKEQSDAFRACVIRGLNKPGLNNAEVQTKEGHIALLASEIHDQQGHENHFHVFLHCHAYDANNSEISKKIDWRKAETRRQIIGAINRELQKAGLVQELNEKGFSDEPYAFNNFVGQDGHSLMGSKAKEAELLQQAGVESVAPVRTITGQEAKPAAPVIVDPEAAKIRNGLSIVEERMAEAQASINFNKQLHEALRHGADAAEQLTQARLETQEATKVKEQVEQTLNEVRTQFDDVTKEAKAVSENLLSVCSPEAVERFNNEGATLTELAAEVLKQHGDLESALETEEQSHNQTKQEKATIEAEKASIEAAKAETETKLADTITSLSNEQEAHEKTRSELAQVEAQIPELEKQHEAEIKGLTDKHAAEVGGLVAQLQAAAQMQEVMQRQFAETLATLQTAKAQAEAQAAQAQRDAEESRLAVSEVRKEVEGLREENRTMRQEFTEIAAHFTKEGEAPATGWERFKTAFKEKINDFKAIVFGPKNDGPTQDNSDDMPNSYAQEARANLLKAGMISPNVRRNIDQGLPPEDITPKTVQRPFIDPNLVNEIKQTGNVRDALRVAMQKTENQTVKAVATTMAAFNQSHGWEGVLQQLAKEQGVSMTDDQAKQICNQASEKVLQAQGLNKDGNGYSR